MQVNLKNIGVIKSADIELDGLTVLTGCNDTGKSTVGKSLYCLYHGLASYNANLDNNVTDYLSTLFSELEKVCLANKIPLTFADILYDISKKTSVNNILSKSVQRLAKFSNYLSEHKLIDNNYKKKLENISKQFDELFTNDFRAQMMIRSLLDKFNEEFNGNPTNIYTKANIYSITINDNDKSSKIIVSKDTIQGIEKLNESGIAFDDAIYIDTPLALSDTTEIIPISYRHIMRNNHIKDLTDKLLEPSSKNKNVAIRVYMENKWKNIDRKIHSVLNGTIAFDNRHLQYKTKDSTFDVGNIANGLKAYGIIRRLIDNGHLDKNVLLIIDEPEVHLHPAWQLDFAELLVMLVHDLDLTMLLTTHSPYFLQALDVFSQRHKIDKKTHFYLAERDGNSATVRNIDDNIDETYKLLAAPIMRLREYAAEQNIDESDGEPC